jgi:hypothetical protein
LAAVDQGKKGFPTVFRCRQRPLQQCEAAQQQFNLLKPEFQQWLAAVQFARACELEGETCQAHGVAQLKSIG